MEAIGTLASQGFSLQAMMRYGLAANSASHCAAGRCGEKEDAPQVPANPTGVTSVSAGAMSYQRSERASLFITTQEGDVVELKIRNKESLQASGAIAEQEGETLSEVNVSASSSTKVSLKIKGDLNEAERTAIAAVIAQAGELAQDFFDGGVADAFSAAETLNVHANQLASVGMRFSLREQFTYAQISQAKPLPAPTAQNTEVPSPMNPPLPMQGAPSGAEIEKVSQPTAASEPMVPAAPPSAEGAFDLIRGFLTRLMDTLAAPAAEASTAKIELSLKLKLFQSVLVAATEEAPQAATSPPPLSPLVPETLDALAAQQTAPLHLVS